MSPEEILDLAAAATAERMTRKYDAIWDFDRCVEGAINEHLPADRQERRALLVRLEEMCRIKDQELGETSCSKTGKWNRYSCVAGCLSIKIAYLTPGFAEAKRFNDIYGS